MENNQDSKWHQCPRCSFWFDCLTEPSFANRPEEAPSSLDHTAKSNFDTVTLNVKQEIRLTPDENIYPLIDEDSSNGDSQIHPDLFGDLLDNPVPYIDPLGINEVDLQAGADEKTFVQITTTKPDIKVEGFRTNKPGGSKKTSALKNIKHEKPIGTVSTLMKRKRGRPKNSERIGITLKRPKVQKLQDATLSENRKKVMLASLCRDFIFSGSDRYFFGDEEIAKEHLDKYYRYKECTICGKVIIDTRLHMLNFHGDAKEVIFNLTSKRPDPRKQYAEGTLPQPILEARQKGIRPPKQCDVCLEWVEKMGNHIFNHKHELFPTSVCGQSNQTKKTCKICQQKVENLSLHMNTIHEQMKCQFCQQKFNNIEDFENHKCSESAENAKTASDNKFQCDICKQNIDGDLTRHLREAHLEPKHYPCLDCNSEFKDIKSLKYHREKHSGLAEACSKCKRVYPGPLHLAYHMELVHSTEGQRFHCDKCGKHYKQMKSLKTHIRDDHSDVPKPREIYECAKCSKRLQSKCALNMHNRRCGNPSRDFQCHQCPKAFVRKNDLERHINCLHSDARPEKCDLCSKTYKVKSALKLHMLQAHSNVKSFVCQECGMAFSIKPGLARHMKNIHGPVGEPIPCEYPDCKSMFKDKRSLKHHLQKIHIETVCRECKMEFRFVQDYRVHMAQHAGKEIFTCPVCQKPYHLRYLLVNHIGRIHKDFDAGLQVAR